MKIGISPINPIPENDNVEIFSKLSKMQDGREAFSSTDKGLNTNAGVSRAISVRVQT